MVTDEQETIEMEEQPFGLDEGEDEEGGDSLVDPFDPTKIRIEARPMTVDLLVRRIKEGALNLSPDFQRKAGLWKPGPQSRLIESMMIRVPIPAFYIDATDEDNWLVVDGLQRLSVLNRFMIKKELKLTDLEFLKIHSGKTFDELPRALQRRIEETQVFVYFIEPGTPPEVKFNIFKRINTGGLPLSPQEIRHALNQGSAADLLKHLVEDEAFQRVAGRYIRDERMSDRECVLRFLAFATTPYDDYRSMNLDVFLNAQMRALGKRPADELAMLEQRFVRAMIAAYEIFGNDAFRKRYKRSEARKPINKALFETWSVNLDALGDEDIARLVERKASLVDGFIKLNNKPDFDKAVSQGTGDVAKVKLRFEEIAKLIQKVLA